MGENGAKLYVDGRAVKPCRVTGTHKDRDVDSSVDAGSRDTTTTAIWLTAGKSPSNVCEMRYSHRNTAIA